MTTTQTIHQVLEKLPDTIRTDDRRASMVDLIRVYSIDEAHRDKYPTTKIAISELIPAQRDVAKSRMAKIASSDHMKEPILVVKVDDKVYIRDGHHRVELLKLFGIETAFAHIAEA